MKKTAGYMTAGEGTPVVFLHSSMSRKEQWFMIFESLKTDHKVIAIDLYGYGDSPFPEIIDGFGLQHEIELIESVLHETISTDEKFHLVGHSYGGAIALRYASLPGNRVMSLSVYEPMLNHVFRETDREMYFEGMDFINGIEEDVVNGNPDAGCSKFIDFFSGEGTFQKLPEQMKKSFRKCVRKMPMDYRATIGDELSVKLYRGITAPVCLISGKRSPELTSVISDLLSETIPDVKYHRVDGGHMAPLEQPGVVNPVIEEFIRGFKS